MKQSYYKINKGIDKKLLIVQKQQQHIMKWNNKIMQGPNDQNTSRLSSRSLSKFKKVNLQKSQAEISSNQHFEKSELKLTSVQKIKTSNHNRSYISNYIRPSLNDNNQLPSPVSAGTQRPCFQFKTSQQKGNLIDAPSDSQNTSFQMNQQENIKIQSQLKDLALFKTLTGKQQSPKKQQSQQIKYSEIVSQNTNPQTQLKEIVQIMSILIKKFGQISLKIKQTLKQDKLFAFQKLQDGILNISNNFYCDFQKSIKQLIELKNHQIKDMDLQKIIKTDLNYSEKAQSESFYKIKYFEHEQIYHQQKQSTKSRPNHYKNRFKQLVQDSNQNFFVQNQAQKIIVKETIGQSSRSGGKKLQRKRTNPTPRINPLFENESFVLNENSLNHGHNTSTNSIKFCKIKDRSASKSVKKLQQRVLSIQNFIKPDTTKSQIQNGENLQQVSSKC